ncbi:MAG: hypothetical protein PF569_02600 [Candidatus Woesearchaeota archaeon]|jgi:hypothetical protein|nr:hypothetical protein [Candidatus Woesearchaeota archaeon]
MAVLGLGSQTPQIFPIIKIKTGYFFPGKGFQNQNQSLLSYKNWYSSYGEFGDRLEELSKKYKGEKYLKETKDDVFKDNFIKSIMYYDSKFKLVEIHSNSSFPSKSESNRESHLLGRIKRRIKDKIEKGQLKGKQNPIIAFQFSDILYMGYHDEKEEFGFGAKRFEAIERTTIKVFEDLGEKEILGVIFYEKYISKGKLIINPNLNFKDTQKNLIKNIMS